MAEQIPGDSVWKNIALFLAGVVMSAIAGLITISHDSIPRAEVEEMRREIYVRMDQQNAAVNAHLESIDHTNIESGKDLARISEHLGVGRRSVTTQ